MSRTSATPQENATGTLPPASRKTRNEHVPNELKSWKDRIIEDDESKGVLSIDLRNFRANAEYAHVRVYNFKELTLFGGYGSGIYSNKVVCLAEFPNFVSALRGAILQAVEKYHQGAPNSRVPQIANTGLRIFCWMLWNGYYTLKQVPHETINRLVSKLSRSTWARILKYRRSLARLYLNAKNDPSIALSLRTRRSRGPSADGINIEELRRLTGLPIDSTEVSESFRRRMAKLRQIARAPRSGAGSGYSEGSSLRAVTETFNYFSSSRYSEDFLQYIPFRALIYHDRSFNGQTNNISLQDAIKISKNSLEWTTERAPIILELISFYRLHLQELHHQKLPYSRIKREIMAAVTQFCTSRQSEAPWLPLPRQRPGKGGGVQGLISALQKNVLMAAACLVGINHGRRINEVVGNDLPYGLHYGCVTITGSLLHDFRIEIYCEKGHQAHKSFPANSIVASVVKVLEQFLDATHVSNAHNNKSNDLYGRKKLFVIQCLWIGLSQQSFQFNFRDSLLDFLGQCGVTHEVFDESQWPFRRMFVDLFLHRYDTPEIIALSKHMGHLTLASTLPYGRDEVGRPSGKALLELRGEGNADLTEIAEALNDGKYRYLCEKTVEMFNLQAIGGMFPRLVLRLAKVLSKNANFSKISAQRKANTIAQILQSHGYTVNPMEHTSCMAGRTGGTIKMAKCYRDGNLHREDASHATCMGCIHSLKTPTHLQNVSQKIFDLRAQSTSLNLPKSLRKAAEEAHEQLQRVFDVEARIARENVELFSALVQCWSLEIVGDRHGI